MDQNMMDCRELHLIARCVFVVFITLGAIGMNDSHRNKIPMACYFGVLLWSAISPRK